MRREGSRLHVTAHLVDARQDRDLWSQSYDLPAAFSSSVVGILSQALRQQLSSDTHRTLAPILPVNQEAYKNYLRGRYEWNKRTPDGFLRASEYFKKSIAADPGFAPAHAGLADAQLSAPQGISAAGGGSDRARPARSRKALPLDNRLAAAHATIGHIHELSYEWTEAESEFRMAIELDPSYATAHQWYSNLLSLLGRHAEAEEQAKLAIQSDPLAPMIQNQLGVAPYYARRYEEAIAVLRKTRDMEPGFHESLMRRARRVRAQPHPRTNRRRPQSAAPAAVPTAGPPNSPKRDKTIRALLKSFDIPVSEIAARFHIV